MSGVKKYWQDNGAYYNKYTKEKIFAVLVNAPSGNYIRINFDNGSFTCCNLETFERWACYIKEKQ